VRARVCVCVMCMSVCAGARVCDVYVCLCGRACVCVCDMYVCLCGRACVQEFVATLLNCVFEAGFCSNHASVKYQIEWMMILILVHYPHHIDSFWACFNRVS